LGDIFGISPNDLGAIPPPQKKIALNSPKLAEDYGYLLPLKFKF
jgi:hypothetical protein